MKLLSRSSALLAAALFSAPLSAQQAVLTPGKVSTMESVAGAMISPDGSMAAYVRVLPLDPLEENGSAHTELHLMDLATGESRPYVTTGSTSGLQWTQDGSGLTFRSKRGDDKFTGVYLLPIGGGEARRIAGLDDRNVSAFDLSGDGRIAMLGTAPVSKELTALRKKGFNQEIYEEDWRAASVFITDLDGGAALELELEGHVSAVEWSPVGDRVAVAFAPTALVDDSYTSKRIAVLDASGAGTICTIGTKGKLGPFDWSPDGKAIALIAAIDEHDGSAARLMFAGIPDSAQTEPVMPEASTNPEGDEHDVHWLPNGQLIVRGSESVWSTVTVFGDSGQLVLPKQGPALRSVSFSADGKSMVATASTSNHPFEMYSKVAGGEFTRRTISNPWLADVALGRQELIKYAARDGVEVHGLLIHPTERAEGQRVPLVVSVHGGPEAHLSNGWITRYSDPGQVAAGLGWAVFYPNYRGSTGRGLAYLKLSQGDPAGSEFDDIVDGVDYLIERGLVDKDKVGVTGGSYGGYATAWLSTKYTERFAAGVMFVGISNKISKVGTTDIPDEEYLVHAMHRPWDDWQLFLERSPIYHAGGCDTPVLIMHGKEDPRVNPGQSKEMYRHLKLRSEAPVRLVLYPGEGHGNRKAAAQYDYSLRQLRWFSLYLDGPGGEMPPHEIDYGIDSGE
ncbi:MAG: dipeptidyl aminopeptidase/acylaminoacyl peptidase [Planctomycetota bacterium]|jgi:dipeptidyl aminopeptidase/acylaminoacyl peptidase